MNMDYFRTYTEFEDYLSKVVDVFSVLAMSRVQWLTDTEKRFFIATVISVNMGYENPTSKEAKQIYEKFFLPKINNTTILDRINKISKKNWLKYQKGKDKKVLIPLFFKNIGTKKDVVDFKVRIDYEQNSINRRNMGENIPIEFDSGE